MRKTILFGIAAAGLMGLAGAGTVAMNKSAIGALAIGGGPFCFAGTATSWATSQVDMSADGSNWTITRTLSHGERFKIKAKDSWDEAYGFSNLASGSANKYFSNSSGDIEAKVGGSYKITLKSTDSKIYIEEAGTTTYSYFLMPWDPYTCVYAYNSESDKYSNWAETPALADLGASIVDKIAIPNANAPENTLFGLYRIEDRILGSYEYIIFKKDGDVTGEFDNQSETFHVSGNQAIYTSYNKKDSRTYTKLSEGDSGYDDLYAGLGFVFDLVQEKGAYKYLEQDYSKSFCSVSKSTAIKLVEKYNSLAFAGAKEIVDTYSFYTYDVSDEKNLREDHLVYTSLPTVMTTIGKIADGALGEVNWTTTFNTNDYNGVVLAGTVSIITLASAAVMLVFHKKKEQ